MKTSVLPGHQLYEARKAHGITLEQLAAHFAVTKQRIGQFEAGSPIPDDRLQAVANNRTAPVWLRSLAAEILVANIEHRLAQLHEQKRALRQAMQTLTTA